LFDRKVTLKNKNKKIRTHIHDNDQESKKILCCRYWI